MQIAWAFTTPDQEHHADSMGSGDVAMSSKEARFGGLFLFLRPILGQNWRVKHGKNGPLRRE